ncbi:hypothetical protein B0T20DRAFT_411855 [Sordaria brevicollis]|uniref:Uncharacterized protein n=1 Tax=Sordaria brevicollis TaxID=83679 RepID=A0AAE0PEZ6_SORBR|nr:hypothetical protein B0T20DRAFT_411855 [Sordaria brevicollis]
MWAEAQGNVGIVTSAWIIHACMRESCMQTTAQRASWPSAMFAALYNACFNDGARVKGPTSGPYKVTEKDLNNVLEAMSKTIGHGGIPAFSDWSEYDKYAEITTRKAVWPADDRINRYASTKMYNIYHRAAMRGKVLEREGRSNMAATVPTPTPPGPRATSSFTLPNTSQGSTAPTASTNDQQAVKLVTSKGTVCLAKDVTDSWTYIDRDDQRPQARPVEEWPQCDSVLDGLAKWFEMQTGCSVEWDANKTIVDFWHAAVKQWPIMSLSKALKFKGGKWCLVERKGGWILNMNEEYEEIVEIHSDTDIQEKLSSRFQPSPPDEQEVWHFPNAKNNLLACWFLEPRSIPTKLELPNVQQRRRNADEWQLKDSGTVSYTVIAIYSPQNKLWLYSRNGERIKPTDVKYAYEEDPLQKPDDSLDYTVWYVRTPDVMAEN